MMAESHGDGSQRNREWATSTSVGAIDARPQLSRSATAPPCIKPSDSDPDYLPTGSARRDRLYIHR